MAAGRGNRVPVAARQFFVDLTARLVAHAAWQFKLAHPLPEGGTLGDAFRQYQRARGVRHPLDTGGEPLPSVAAYVLEWFWEIAAGRPIGPSGPLPVPSMEIAAWAALRGIQLRGWEVRALRLLDAKWLEVSREASRSRGG